MKIVFLGTYILTALFGQLCTMPMANAQGMPMQETETQEMVMTPIEPMSPVHCEHCPKHTKQAQPAPASSCAGHCLSQAANAHPTTVSFATQEIVTPLPIPTDLTWQEQNVLLAVLPADSPPGLLHTAAVVLRL